MSSFPAPDHASTVAKLGDLAAEAGLQRVSILAWRDLDDPEAGGSELHAHHVASLWAEAGVEVTMRTSYAAGHPQITWRNGYRSIRKAGRYLVFPRAAFSEMMGWHGGRDGLVEIWNGMPFFSPLWSRTPHVTWLHHVHAEMWDMTLPPNLARLGNFVESSLAPKVYRRTPIVTLSESSKRELVEDLGFKAKRVTVVPPGIDPRFSVNPDVPKDPQPLVVAVGRLVPVKRFDALIEALCEAHESHPAMRAVVVGEGYEREALETLVHERRAEGWLSLPGRVSDDALVDLYRRAWLLVSMSAREGWGMTVTEAAACGTPAVATRIAGHEDAVDDGGSGILVDDTHAMAAAVRRVIGDDALRARLRAGALERSTRYTWENTARGTLEVLAAEAIRVRGRLRT
ncbi:MAG: glycosyltransferase family 4 protein [Acidimicrobiia bacterium]